MEYVLEKLDLYNSAEDFLDEIWNIVIEWDYFKKDTIGKQLVRAADSISANIAEGYGRYFYKESKQFYSYSRGSIQETKSWLSKCLRRKIIEEKDCYLLIERSQKLLLQLKSYIRFVAKSQTVKQPNNKLINQLTNKPINAFPHRCRFRK